MVLYTCKICGYSVNDKSRFDKHLNRKFPCKPKTISCNKKIPDPSASQMNPFESQMNPSASLISQPIMTPIDTLNCIYCGKQFTLRTNLTRHMNKSCKILKNQFNNPETDLLKQKNKELEAKIDKLTVQLINKPSVV